MFVEQVTKQTGSLKIKTQGRVSSEQVISALRKKGILEIVVDLSKSDLPGEHEPEAEAEPELAELESHEYVPFEDEINRASALYLEAKNIQKQLLDNMANGEPLDLEPARDISGQFVASIKRNPNAMLCMTHIRGKDAYLLEHSLNVAVLMATFAKFLGLDQELVDELAFAGLLHDIGKVDIPDKILLKPAKLTDPEMKIMKGHVQAGIDALEYMPDVSPTLLEVVALHHEKVDGTGYPNQVPGDEITQFGRMISIADCYDAMTADRCYKKGMPAAKAMKVLLKYAGSHFDKALVNQFISCFGVYPAGTLVRLKSEKLALITETTAGKPLAPKVKSFYSLRTQHFIPPKDIDLADKRANDEILEPMRAEDLSIDYKRYFAEQVCA